jgi:hypothetical protein
MVIVIIVELLVKSRCIYYSPTIFFAEIIPSLFMYGLPQAPRPIDTYLPTFGEKAYKNGVIQYLTWRACLSTG